MGGGCLILDRIDVRIGTRCLIGGMGGSISAYSYLKRSAMVYKDLQWHTMAYNDLRNPVSDRGRGEVDLSWTG